MILFQGDDNVLCINSKAITVAGVNRHEFDPTHGRAVSVDTMREDAMLMKQLNFNAVRCAHYPHHRLWLEICDEAGLYVVDEANIETHGFQVRIKRISNYLVREIDRENEIDRKREEERERGRDIIYRERDR